MKLMQLMGRHLGKASVQYSTAAATNFDCPAVSGCSSFQGFDLIQVMTGGVALGGCN